MNTEYRVGAIDEVHARVMMNAVPTVGNTVGTSEGVFGQDNEKKLRCDHIFPWWPAHQKEFPIQI